MDMVINMRRMPLVGETVLGDSLFYVPGGKGANQAYAIGKLGGSITMLGCVGEDNFGDTLLDSLKSCGANVSHLRRAGQTPTGTAAIYVDESGNNSIVVVPGANNMCSVDYLREKEFLFDECDYVVLQMEIPYDAVFYAIKKAKERGKTVVLNPAPAPESLPEDILPLIDYLTPNETELMKLSGASDNSLESLECGARKLLASGVHNVLVTVGEKGALLVNAQGARVFEPRRVSVVDTTAAGDCFNGAFVLALSEGKEDAQAIAFANAASSVAITRKGAQSSIPVRAEAEQALGEMQSNG